MTSDIMALLMLSLCFPVLRLMNSARVAGMHAQVLNRVVSELRESAARAEELGLSDASDSVAETGPLKEVLGHTPRQASAEC